MKNFFVATAIPYVNAKPHLGHALLFTYGDVLARYRRSLGDNVIFSIGTDEHGSKVAEKAADEGLAPKIFADRVSAEFRLMAERLGISHNRFIRTSDAEHRRRVGLIWENLKEYIYKDIYEGWYCKGCEAYQTETTVKANEGQCPDHKRPYEKLREENYFFKLSAFTQSIKEHIESDRLKIVPEAAKSEALGMLKQGLEDISFSRSVENLTWGIEVPEDPEQVIYVWCDALANYVTVLGYPDGADFKSHWPADVQMIGRDILRFHAIYWPAMLLGLKLPLYRQLYVHGLVTVEGQKMSKTVGNTVDPLELVEAYSLEAFRYFFMRHLPAYDNGDYSLKRFTAVYNNELVDQLGNLVHRLQSLVWQKLDGRLPGRSEPTFATVDFSANYHQLMLACRFDQALALVFTEIKALNKALEITQPWALDDRSALEVVLDQISETLKDLNTYLQPFLPNLSERISQIFASQPIAKIEQPLLPKIDLKN